jgi:hypothetical protein
MATLISAYLSCAIRFGQAIALTEPTLTVSVIIIIIIIIIGAGIA